MVRMVPLNPVPPPELDGRTRRAPVTVEEAKAMLLADRGFVLWSILRNNFSAVAERMQAAGVQDLSAANLYRLGRTLEPEEATEVFSVPWITGTDTVMDRAVGELMDRASAGAAGGGDAERFPLAIIPATLMGASNYFQQAALNEASEAATEVAQAQERNEAILAEARSAQRAAAWADWRTKYGWTLWVAAAAALVLILLLIRYLRTR